MSKTGVSAVSGNIVPIVGEKHIYQVVDWYPSTPQSERDLSKVTWELFKKRRDGRFTTTNIRKKGDSSFTFGEASLGNTYRLEAYLHKPEGGGLIITPKQNKIPQISKVELFYVDDKKGSTFSFMEQLRAKAYCINMFHKEVIFTLWEDDAKGSGHNPNNKPIETLPPKRVNENGIAVGEFVLTKALMQKAMQGEFDPKQLEFYVTVEYYKNKKHDSENVNVKNPLYWTPGVVPPPIGTKLPEPRIPKAKGSPAEQKPISKKEEKGIGDKIADAGKELWDWWESKGTIKKDQEPTRQKPEGKSPVIVSEVKQQEKKQDDKKVCECEAKVRAFMRMLRFKEGTDDEGGYTTQYSGKQFSDFSTHPQKVITDSKEKHSSSAAGAYQIMTDTWKNLTGYYKGSDKNWHYSEKLDYAKKYNITSFDQESQDKFCLVIMKHNYLHDRADSFYDPTYWKNKEKKIHDTVKEAKEKEWRKRFKGQQGDIVQMIIDNDIKRAALISSLCWASLPDSPYGQQSSAYTFAIVKAIYENYLRQELTETQIWNLHLKKGFLKEFGYGCCGEKVEEQTINPESKCPEDCSQCFEYADVIDNPKINNQSGNKNHNRYKKELRYNAKHPNGYYHTGTDILASVGTNVHSMMCGEIVHVRTDLPQNNYAKGYESPSSFGNTITIKSKDKDNKTVYHFYAHLSKVNVTAGQKVKHNDVIGLSGSTGNAMHVDTIYKHVHVEAGTSYRIYGGSDNKLKSMVSEDVNPENLMKTKFDNKGNNI